ncbi:hypothetical protein D3C78_1677740 [compost metagenome]
MRELRSISPQVAFRISEVRQEVRIVSSKARALMVSCFANSAIKVGSSPQTMAAWLFTTRTLERFGSSLSK